jgi:formamidopyrimidine-DNA glycosylase
MAELAEVETFRRQLVKKICGKRIKRVCMRESSLVFRNFANSKKLPEILEGKKIIEVNRRCKYLLIRIEGNLTLVIHPGMTGNLFLGDKKAERDQHCHLELYFERFKLTFRDPRMFGRVILLIDKDLSCFPGLGCLGPEPLSKDFNEKWLFEKLHNRKAPIKSLLLDQRIACGVGNIYADEACFRAGISPLRPGKDLNRKELKRLSESIKFVLRKAIRNAGTTIRDYRTSEGRVGSNRPVMYGRKGKPCIRCGGKIIRTIISGRSTFYCPICQR